MCCTFLRVSFVSLLLSLSLLSFSEEKKVWMYESELTMLETTLQQSHQAIMQLQTELQLSLDEQTKLEQELKTLEQMQKKQTEELQMLSENWLKYEKETNQLLLEKNRLISWLSYISVGTGTLGVASLIILVLF